MQTEWDTKEKDVIRLRREHLDWSSLYIAQIIGGVSRPWVASVLKKYRLSTTQEVIDGLPLIRLKNINPEINQHMDTARLPVGSDRASR